MIRSAMSSIRELAIVPFSTKAVRFAPHQLVPELKVISPGIDICASSLPAHCAHSKTWEKYVRQDQQRQPALSGARPSRT